MTIPRLTGVSRLADSPKSLCLHFDRELTDDEVRQVHASLRPDVPLSTEVVADRIVRDLVRSFGSVSGAGRILQDSRPSIAAAIEQLRAQWQADFVDMYGDVGNFHRKFDLPAWPAGEPPHVLDDDALAFRGGFMDEELREFRQATEEGDVAAAADALADLVYVALGTAHLMALPFDLVWAEVQRANMTKVRAQSANDPLSVRKHSMDMVKPPGFRPPDHRRALGLPIGVPKP